MDVFIDDLELYLGVDVDASRAQFLLEQAAALCASVVSPLPVAAKVFVLSAAARAYTNPEGVISETVGAVSVQRPSPGIYLTKAERAGLRRLSGTGGAFSVNPTPTDASPLGSYRQAPYLDQGNLDVSDNFPYFDRP